MLRGKSLSRALAGGLAVLFMGSLLAACDPQEPNGDSPAEPQQPGMQSPDSGGDAGGGAYPGGGEQQN